MKRLLALPFLLLASSAIAQDITWTRGGVKQLPDSGTAGTASERAEGLRQFFSTVGGLILPGDTIALRGDFDFGKDTPVRFPACSYVGEGATLRHQIMIDRTEFKPLGTPGFLVGVGGKATAFSKVRFVWKCWNVEEDCGGIGWNEPGDGTLVFNDCEFDASSGCDWPIYNWTPGRKLVFILGGTAKSCRWLVAMADSGADNGQQVEIRGLTAILDASGSRTYGESSNADPENGASLALVMIRGGKAVLRNVDVTARGLTSQYDPRPVPKWGCSRIASLVTSRYYSEGQAVSVTVDRCRSAIAPGLSSAWYDIDLRPADKLTVIEDLAKVNEVRAAGMKAIAAATEALPIAVAKARGGSAPDGSMKKRP